MAFNLIPLASTSPICSSLTSLASTCFNVGFILPFVCEIALTYLPFSDCSVTFNVLIAVVIAVSIPFDAIPLDVTSRYLSPAVTFILISLPLTKIPLPPV